MFKRVQKWSRRATATTFLRLLITFGALAIVVVREVWPDLKLDAVTLGLFVVALIPWLGRIFKSIKFPGGYEFNYANFEALAGDVPEPPTTRGSGGQRGVGSAGAAYLDGWAVFEIEGYSTPDSRTRFAR